LKRKNTIKEKTSKQRKLSTTEKTLVFQEAMLNVKQSKDNFKELNDKFETIQKELSSVSGAIGANFTASHPGLAVSQKPMYETTMAKQKLSQILPTCRFPNCTFLVLGWFNTFLLGDINSLAFKKEMAKLQKFSMHWRKERAHACGKYKENTKTLSAQQLEVAHQILQDKQIPQKYHDFLKVPDNEEIYFKIWDQSTTLTDELRVLTWILLGQSVEKRETLSGNIMSQIFNDTRPLNRSADAAEMPQHKKN